VEDYLALCPYGLPAKGPLFVGQKGGPLSPRIIQLAVEGLRGALGLDGQGHAARAPPFLRDASLSRGGELRSIQELLGHASLRRRRSTRRSIRRG
jgi:integrase/recombinase XerC